LQNGGRAGTFSFHLIWEDRIGYDNGRHFGRTIHALCTVSALLNNGILRMGELAEQAEEAFTHEYYGMFFLAGIRN
jgi:hypothetical protein